MGEMQNKGNDGKERGGRNEKQRIGEDGKERREKAV